MGKPAPKGRDEAARGNAPGKLLEIADGDK